MKPWQVNLRRLLASADAPPVLSRDLLSRFAKSARDGESIAARSLSHWIRSAVQEDRLRLIVRGLYLNYFRSQPGTPADAVHWLRNEAVVSLNTVLGDAGVLNNPVRTIMAIVPINRRGPQPRLGAQQTGVGTYHFFGMPREVMNAGDESDRLEPSPRYDHLRATPERALADWVYLGMSPRSRRTLPPRDDIDLDMLDRTRLHRITNAMGIADATRAWIDSA